MSIAYTLRNDLLNFLLESTPMFTLGLFFGLIELLVAFPLKGRISNYVCSSVLYRFIQSLLKVLDTFAIFVAD